MPKAQVRLRHDEGYRTTIQSRHHTYYSDEPASDGGLDSAPTPTEMAMGALGACIAMTVKMYAQRKGWDLQEISVALDFSRFNGKDYPAYEGSEPYVHEVRKAIQLTGNLDEEQRERLLDIASKCPVHRLLTYPTFWESLELSEEL